jgi:RNA polymerase sigma-70 factor (ECF subfamily)
MQDEEIISNIKSGGKEAFGLLVEKYGDQLYSFIRYSMRDEGAAGDIYQEALLKAFGGIDKYKEEGKFKTWLFTIARNKITDHFRKNSRFVQFGEEQDAADFAASDNTQKAALSNISLREIKEHIGRLPKEQREVILLRTYLSFKEIASVLGCPLGTVLARMSRGVNKLRQYLGEEYAA